MVELDNKTRNDRGINKCDENDESIVKRAWLKVIEAVMVTGRLPQHAYELLGRNGGVIVIVAVSRNPTKQIGLLAGGCGSWPFNGRPQEVFSWFK